MGMVGDRRQACHPTMRSAAHLLAKQGLATCDGNMTPVSGGALPPGAAAPGARGTPMEAEQQNQIANTLADLRSRAAELRRYL